jgi:putative two-component system response regulator
MAVADVYDALICKRIYKPAFTHDEAVNIIVKGKGFHFDPVIIDAFIAVLDECKEIATRFAD